MAERLEFLKKKIKALIAFRALFVTLLLGSAFLFKAGYEKFPHAHLLSYLIVAMYVFTITYSLLLERIKRLVAFAYAQLMLDVFFGIILIYLTGAIESWFSFALVLTIISSSIVLNRRAGYIAATLCSILYGTLINIQFHELLPLISGGTLGVKDYLYNIFIHTLSFYITAYLSGYLSSRLEKAAKKLDEKDIDLRGLEFFNKEVIESLPSGLFTTDTSGSVIIFNKAAERITGIKNSAIIGERIDELLPYFRFPFTGHRSEETIRVDGVQKVIGFQISPLRDLEGNETGFIGIFQDLTELKRLETEMKLREKWATIGELSSSIAHEIRNPLASMKSAIEMLRENRVPMSHREKLMEIALKEMERLNRIITDFLTYSRPAQPEIEQIELHSILDETIELLKHAEQNRGKIFINKKYTGILEVNVDAKKMRQVFWNLGINALEAMPEGGELVVSTKNSDRAIEITFKDSGVGINEHAMEKIFYPFFTTKDNGTGLGLSIAYRIVEEHAGKIHVKSSPGAGATFEIILPKTDGKT